MACYLLTYNDASERRRNDRISWDIRELGRQTPANLGRQVRILQDQGALEELAAMESGAKDEVPV
jgi:hypothetical protein